MGIQDMMKQAQEMQERIQREMSELSVQATSGGGMVTVSVNGHKHLQRITIDPEVVSKEDVGMLQDLIVAAVNEGIRKAQELQAQGFGGITSTLGGMPGLGNLLGQ
jgi:nucleoid-associated protein EbfC